LSEVLIANQFSVPIQGMGLREQKKEEQRRDIFRTAFRLFHEKGYDQTRVQDIIEPLKISEATFFNYFPNKEALLDEVTVQQLELSAMVVRTELGDKKQSVRDRVKEYARGWAQAWGADREFMVVVLTRSNMLRASGSLKEKQLGVYRLLGDLFRQGQARGEIRADRDPVQLGEILTAICAFTCGNWLIGWWPDSSEELEPRLMRAIDVFLDGCASPKKQRAAVKVSRPRK